MELADYEDTKLGSIDEVELIFSDTELIIKDPNGIEGEVVMNKDDLIIKGSSIDLIRCFHTDINKINVGDQFLAKMDTMKEQKRYDKIYNACLLDKAQGMSMEVDSVRDAVEGACDDIAKDPSWLENWKYN